MFQLSLWTDLVAAIRPASQDAGVAVADDGAAPGEGGAADMRPLPSPASTESLSLARRLRGLGLPPVRHIELHRNRQVMLSWKPGVLLRIHEGYGQAPDAVLKAIVTFLRPGIHRPARLAARRLFLDFSHTHFADAAPPSQRIPRLRSGDAPLMAELQRLFTELNGAHFGGTLGPIPLHLSDRMRSRLGELRLDRQSGRAERITLSRRHLRRDGWVAVRETLLHEMVHQWQAETGQPVDHGTGFRRKAMAVGITPRAVRVDF